MTDIEALKTLLERVEKGEDLNHTTGFAILSRAVECLTDASVIRWALANHITRAFESSLDAALALHNAVLPGRSWIMDAHGGYLVEVWSGVYGDDDFRLSFAVSDTPARAWLIAIIKAKIAELEE